MIFIVLAICVVVSKKLTLRGGEKEERKKKVHEFCLWIGFVIGFYELFHLNYGGCVHQQRRWTEKILLPSASQSVVGEVYRFSADHARCNPAEKLNWRRTWLANHLRCYGGSSRGPRWRIKNSHSHEKHWFSPHSRTKPENFASSKRKFPPSTFVAPLTLVSIVLYTHQDPVLVGCRCKEQQSWIYIELKTEYSDESTYLTVDYLHWKNTKLSVYLESSIASIVQR